MKYFLPLIAMLVLLACQNKEQKSELEQVSEKFTRHAYQSEELAKITDINISLVAVYPDGHQMLLADSINPSLFDSLEAGLPIDSIPGLDSAQIVVIIPMTDISLDLDGDHRSDTIIQSKYYGQKKVTISVRGVVTFQNQPLNNKRKIVQASP